MSVDCVTYLRGAMDTLFRGRTVKVVGAGCFHHDREVVVSAVVWRSGGEMWLRAAPRCDPEDWRDYFPEHLTVFDGAVSVPRRAEPIHPGLVP